jgi:hypothetical protein
MTITEHRLSAAQAMEPPSLSALEIAAARAKAVLDAHYDELIQTFRLGNPSRIGNAAHDADMAALELSGRLGDVFARAAEIDSEEQVAPEGAAVAAFAIGQIERAFAQGGAA